MIQKIYRFAVLICLVGVCYTAEAARCHVAPNGQASQNGGSWAAATTLHKALATPSCTAIWMKAGTYYPVTPVDLANVTQQERGQHFLIDRPLHLFGGFAGIETQMSQRVLSTDTRTILSGDIDRNDTNTDGNHINELWTQIQGSNSMNVLKVHQPLDSAVSFTPKNTLLNGFTVTGAQGLSGILMLSEGAGGTQFAPRLSTITVQGNNRGGTLMYKAARQAFFGLAGGINLLMDRTHAVESGAELFRVHIENNNKGGLLVRVENDRDAPLPLPSKMVWLHSSTITKNRSDGNNAGGMTTFLPTLISHSIFDQNSQKSLTSALASYSKLMVQDSIFKNHTVFGTSPLYVESSATIQHVSFGSDEELEVKNTTIRHNQPRVALVSNNRSSATLTNTDIHHNKIGVVSARGKMYINRSSIHNNANTALVLGQLNGQAGVSGITDVYMNASSVFGQTQGFFGIDKSLSFTRPFSAGVDVGNGNSLTVTDSTIWNKVINWNGSTPQKVTFKRSIVASCDKGETLLLRPGGPISYDGLYDYQDLGGNAFLAPLKCDKNSPSSIALSGSPLEPSGNYGGITPVLMPKANSPLVDAISCPAGIKDQRGVARPQGSQCDIGAVERRFGSKTLTVTIAPGSQGKGSVSAEPAASSGSIQNCTTQCSAQYDDESIVSQITLMANPTSPNKAFWSGDCVSNGRGNQAVVSIDKPTLQCTVTFKTEPDPIDPMPPGTIFQNSFE